MNKTLIIIGLLITVLVGVPLTLYLITSGGGQPTTTKASPATHILFTPSSQTINVGDTTKFDLDLDPGSDQGKNTITFINLTIQFNASALQAAPGVGENGTGLVINGYTGPDGSQQSFVELQAPAITCSNQCVITVSLGVKPNATISRLEHAFVSLNLQAKPTAPAGEAQVSLTGSKVLSIGQNDQASENVLLPPDPASITINELSPAPTSSDTTDTTTPTSGDNGGTDTSGNTGGNTGTTQQLTCSSFTADPSSTTSAPLDTAITVAGTAGSGTISKVSFNFGDGSVQDVTSAGGIGTDAVNIQINHTYQTTGTFTATATLTGDSGSISDPSSCSQTITVGQPDNSGSTTSGATPTPQPLPSTGPGETLLIIGAIGTAIAVGGALLFFGL